MLHVTGRPATRSFPIVVVSGVFYTDDDGGISIRCYNMTSRAERVARGTLMGTYGPPQFTISPRA